MTLMTAPQILFQLLLLNKNLQN